MTSYIVLMICFDNMLVICFPFEKVKICSWSVYSIANFELITSTLVSTGKKVVVNDVLCFKTQTYHVFSL